MSCFDFTWGSSLRISEILKEQVSLRRGGLLKPRYFLKSPGVQGLKRKEGVEIPPALKFLPVQITELAADLGKVHCSLFGTCYIVFKFPLAS